FSLFKQGLKNLSASIDFKDETPQEYNLDWMNEAENEYKNLGLEGTLIDLEDFYTFYAMELKEPLKDLLVNFAKSPKENQDAVLSLLKTTAQNQNN
ncbi:XRE family transcriptional regulator, partial [Streptococcus agalactiae]|nr:XRE family transcriptional regulator [Streptococcus agalactiae]